MRFYNLFSALASSQNLIKLLLMHLWHFKSSKKSKKSNKKNLPCDKSLVIKSLSSQINF